MTVLPVYDGAAPSKAIIAVKLSLHEISWFHSLAKAALPFHPSPIEALPWPEGTGDIAVSLTYVKVNLTHRFSDALARVGSKVVWSRGDVDVLFFLVGITVLVLSISMGMSLLFWDSGKQ